MKNHIIGIRALKLFTATLAQFPLERGIGGVSSFLRGVAFGEGVVVQGIPGRLGMEQNDSGACTSYVSERGHRIGF